MEMAAITSTLIFNFARKHGTWINERLSVNGIPFTVSIGTENKSWIHRLSIGERPIAQAVIDFPARKEDDASIVLHFRNYAGEIAKQLERHFDQHR